MIRNSVANCRAAIVIISGMKWKHTTRKLNRIWRDNCNYMPSQLTGCLRKDRRPKRLGLIFDTKTTVLFNCAAHNATCCLSWLGGFFCRPSNKATIRRLFPYCDSILFGSAVRSNKFRYVERILLHIKLCLLHGSGFRLATISECVSRFISLHT